MTDTTGVIKSVASRDAGSKKIYDVVADLEIDGFPEEKKLQTWDADMAKKAVLAQKDGGTFHIRYGVVPREGYPDNWYLNDIAKSADKLKDPPKRGGGGSRGGGSRGRSPEEQLLIASQWAYGRGTDLAVALYAGAGPDAAPEAFKLAKTLGDKFLKVVPQALLTGGAAQPVEATPVTAESVAADVPGVDVGTENVKAPEATADTVWDD